jgi:hypothetical protein
MKLGIVIPFVNETYIHDLLDDIFHNDGRPDIVLLVDNRVGLKPFDFRPSNIQSAVVIYRPIAPMSVNEVWNWGIKTLMEDYKCDLVSVFNDDLRLERQFFWKMRNLIEDSKNQKYGVFCAETMRMPNFPLSNEYFTKPMSRREGWAWTIRAEVAKQLPVIPEELRTFCGDDWIYTWCERFGRPWAKMMGVRLFHYIGGTLKTADGTKSRDSLESEKKAFCKAI